MKFQDTRVQRKLWNNKNWKGTTLRYGQEEILVNKIESYKRGRRRTQKGRFYGGRERDSCRVDSVPEG